MELLKILSGLLLLRLFLIFQDDLTYAAIHVGFELSLLQGGTAHLTLTSLASAVSEVLIKTISALTNHKLAVLALDRLHKTIVMVFLHHEALAIEVLTVLALDLKILRHSKYLG